MRTCVRCTKAGPELPNSNWRGIKLGIRILCKSCYYIEYAENKEVCGLHVPWNLQLLTAKENRSKHNKFDGTYENLSWRSSD